jgi:hypothetical protein
VEPNCESRHDLLSGAAIPPCLLWLLRHLQPIPTDNRQVEARNIARRSGLGITRDKTAERYGLAKLVLDRR